MKRRTISLSEENFGRVAIDIGRVAENQAVQVRVDLSKFLLQEPKATASLAVESPSGERYPAITRMEGQNLIWDVAAADVASAGMGKTQLTIMGANGEVLKSAVAVIRISDSIVGNGQAPNPVQNWIDSATKALNEAYAIVAELQQKLDNGDFNGKDGEPGKDGEQGPQGEPGSDASVTADNIQSALGYTPVKDVHLNGESLVQNSVATIPLAGYNRLGAVQLDPSGFAAASVEGKLALVPPTDAQISTHTYTQRPITPSCMDYAVKAAMCDGKGAAWTEAEQKAARERMGVDKQYELIETITISAETRSIERNLEPNGTTYHFRKMYVNIITPQAEENGFIYSTFNNIFIGLSNNCIISQQPEGGIAQIYAHVANGFLDGYGIGGANQGTSASPARYTTQANVPSGISAINSMRILATVNIPINSNIAIYGVRA